MVKTGKKEGIMTQVKREQRDQLLNKLIGFLDKKLDNLMVGQEVGAERTILISGEWYDLFLEYPKLEDWIIQNLEHPYTSENTEVIIGFDDEWDLCSDCGKAFKMDECQYIQLEAELLCIECAPDCFEEIIKEYNNQWDKALPYWFTEYLEKDGWEKLNEDSYENGLHEHQNDSPEQVFNEFTEKWQNLIFAIDSISPFTVEFDIYGKRDESKDESYIKTYTVHDVLKAGYTLQPLRCVHCDKIGEVVFHQYMGDGCCQECGQWQLEEKEVI